MVRNLAMLVGAAFVTVLAWALFWTVEGQITGKEESGGIQLIVYDAKAGRFPDVDPRPKPEPGSFFNEATFSPWGLDLVNATSKLGPILARNVPNRGATPIEMTQAGWHYMDGPKTNARTNTSTNA